MQHDSTEVGFPLWTVYENPTDYPGKFVVRKSYVVRMGVLADVQPTIVCGCLAEAREAIPPYCVRLDRAPGDDPKIVEVWL